MRFFKRLLPVLLCASLLLSSAGCGTGEEREPAADSETEQAFETTEAQAAVPDDEVIVNFAVSPLEAGSISGVVSQTLRKGERTTEVEAVPAAGFSFVKWSDGEKNAVHRGESYSDNTTLYALFEEADDATPAIYIDTEGGKKIRSDADTVAFTLSAENLPRRYQVSGATGQIKLRGNASLGWEKKSYTLKFDDKIKFCGLGEGKNRNWVLISNHCDQSLLRNYIAFWLQKKLDGIPWGPDSRMVDLYVNGDYVGDYLLVEKVTGAENRIGLETMTDTGKLDADFMVELDNYAYKAGEKGLAWFTARGYPYEIRGEDSLTSDRCNYIDDWVTSAWDTVCDGSDDEIRRLIDVDAAVDSYILAELTKNIDCGWSSFFLYRKGGKLYLGPSWDFDLAMGNDMRLDNGSYKKLYAGQNNGFGQQNHWYIELVERKWFSDLVTARWNEMKEKGVFDDMLAEVDRSLEMNRESFEHNFERWPIFGWRLNQEPEHVMALRSVDEHVSYLKEWLENRILWLDEKFNS
jgi:hypothetical protein